MDLKDRFKEKFKKNGQSFRWFHDNYIKNISTLTYSGFMSQLNGYAPLANFVREAIEANLDMETTANDNRL